MYRPRRDERLSWPGWLTYSGRFTHISGHPSATGRAQDRESSPAKDRRSTTVPRNQPTILLTYLLTYLLVIIVATVVHNKADKCFSPKMSVFEADLYDRIQATYRLRMCANRI